MPSLVFRHPDQPGVTYSVDVAEGADVGGLIESMRPWELDVSHADVDAASVPPAPQRVVLPQGEPILLNPPVADESEAVESVTEADEATETTPTQSQPAAPDITKEK